jgi:hypothetical protein
VIISNKSKKYQRLVSFILLVDLLD